MTVPVTPVAAATVVLVRDGDPWECYMVRRHVKSEFAADVYVFPGGKVDPADDDPDVRNVVTQLDGREEADASLSMRLAAIRELFEEAGVLLASREGRSVRFTAEVAQRLSAYRRQVHAGELSMLALARQEDLQFDVDRLRPISRWITPQGMPRRFDTVFFVARIPAQQTPLHDAVETSAGEWISPPDALERSARGSFPLVFATEKHLERLSRFPTVDDLLQSVTPADLEPVTPKVLHTDAGPTFLLPGDDGYDDPN